MKKEEIKKGDTVSVGGKTGIYFEAPNLGVVAIRPVPAIKMTERDAKHHETSRGLEFYIMGLTNLYHIEDYQRDGEIIPNARIVLVEKSIEHLTRVDKTKQRIIKK
jgi:hypothetical protein